MLDQVSVEDQLVDGMGNLQKEVKYLGDVPRLTVGVFQFIAMVFLDIEALIFNFPSAPSSLIGKGHDRLAADREIRDPGEIVRFGRIRLAAFKGCQAVALMG